MKYDFYQNEINVKHTITKKNTKNILWFLRKNHKKKVLNNESNKWRMKKYVMKQAYFASPLYQNKKCNKNGKCTKLLLQNKR